jgi:hypothetical protein
VVSCPEGSSLLAWNITFMSKICLSSSLFTERVSHITGLYGVLNGMVRWFFLLVNELSRESLESLESLDDSLSRLLALNLDNLLEIYELDL